MTLIELCEPAFQYVCRLNRIVRNGGDIPYTQLREEVKSILSKIAYEAESEPLLNARYQKIKLPLIFFTDSMIVESGVGCSNQWHDNRLSYDFNELAGDEAFFDFLERAIGDNQPDEAEILAFSYICLGLGFTGVYFGQPELLRQKMAVIQPRIRNLGDFDLTSKFCQRAYESLNTTDLVERPTSRLLGIAIMFCGMTALVLLAVIITFRSSTSALNRALETIIEQENRVSFLAK